MDFTQWVRDHGGAMSKEHRLGYELDDRIEEALITGHAGVPLVIELFRASGAAAVMDAQVVLKQRARGLSVSQTAESLFALWSAGGERCEDLKQLVKDKALEMLLGHAIAPATTVRDFLERFHAEDLPLLQAGAAASVPAPSGALQGLGASNRQVLLWGQQRTPERTATLDVDGSIYETHKRSALTSYEGTRGYQPVTVLWAEKDLIVHEEFRDGNVPAQSGNWRVVRTALEQLPAGIEQRFLRGDAGLYEHELLRNLDREKIGYAISAPLSRELAARIAALPDEAWQDLGRERDALRQWAEVDFCPNDGDWRKSGPIPRRYLAIRVLKTQGALFTDGSDRRHFAVVTNLDWAGDKIIGWHREKAGTIEHAHDVLKNGLAAGAFPSSKFGANAAWFRLNALLYNLLSLLKRETLPGEFHTAKPKRLRFALLNTVGRLVRHANETLLRLVSAPIRSLFDLARVAIHVKRPLLLGV
jgi:hypothetical protein